MAKVCVVASYAPSLINFRGPLIRALAERGHEVTGCAPGLDETIQNGLQMLRASAYSLQMNRTGTNPLADIALMLSLVELFRRIQPDVVLSYTIKPVVYGTFAATLARVPRSFSLVTGLGYSFTRHDERFDLKQWAVNRIIQTLYRTALARNERVFFQNPDDRRLFADLKLVRAEKTIVTNGSGVDLAHYTRVPIKPGPTTFLLIARLLYSKGIREYVEAARLVKAQFPDARFQLLGPFDSNPAAISPTEIQTWHEAGIIEYLGATTDIRPFMAECSVYVLPSYREGTPRTVLEAMAMGRPVITTDVPGCRQTIRHGENGLLVRPQDVQDLASAMIYFLRNTEKIHEMGEKSHALVVEKFDANQINVVLIEAMGL